MKYKSALVTQGSGSVGGMVASHNAGGMYLRARTIPTNPNTPQQAAIRGLLRDLAIAWYSELTAPERLAWTVYAANVPVINALGDTIFLSGINHFIRANTPRLQAAALRIDSGPTTFNLGSFTNPTITASEATQLISLAFTNTDAWAIGLGGNLLLYTSRPQNASINFFKGPYQYSGKVAGAVIPPTSPKTFTPPFAIVEGTRIFAMVRASQIDGRLSTEYRFQCDSTA
jgi:hypothetical protein